MKYRFISLLLALILLCPAACASEGAFFTVHCYSNVIDDSVIELYIENQQAYISVPDAARLSAFTVKSQSANAVTFVRGNTRVSISIGRFVEGKAYMPLESTLDELQVRAENWGSGVVFTAFGYGTDTLFALTDKYMDVCAQYDLLTDGDGFLRFTGLVGTVYKRLTGFKLLGSLMGWYDEDQFAAALAEILKLQGSTQMMKEMVSLSKTSSMLKKFYEAAPASDLHDLYETLKIHDLLSDPFAGLIEETTKLKFKGLSLYDQIAFFGQMTAISTCSNLGMNMIRYTYDQDMLGSSRKNYLPGKAEKAVQQLLDMWNSARYQKEITNVYLEELEYIATETLEGAFTAQIDSLFAKSYVSLAAKVTGFLIKTLSPATTDAIDFAEQYMYLAALQEPLPKLYQRYRKNDAAAINAKYTAIMSLRIIQSAYELSVKKGGIKDTFDLPDLMQEGIDALLLVDDASLISKTVKNDKIDTVMLSGVSHGTQGKLWQLWAENAASSQQPEIFEGYTAAENTSGLYIDGVQIGQIASWYFEYLGTPLTAEDFLVILQEENYFDDYSPIVDLAYSLPEISRLKLVQSELYRFEMPLYEEGYTSEIWIEFYRWTGEIERHGGKQSFDLLVLTEGSSEGGNICASLLLPQ